MDSDSSYWDLYCDEADNKTSPLPFPLAFPESKAPARGLSEECCGRLAADNESSRDSYWSRYSAVQTTNQQTPSSKASTKSAQQRLLVVPRQLEMLSLGNEKQPANDIPDDCGQKETPDQALISDCDSLPIDSPDTPTFTGVNPLALIIRLNFLKDQMEQNERLLLNPMV
ncbi:hypothetical protein LPJ78_003047 [Coemansia sp. RSA 989]|nr:hypothetical protein LPJ68_002686 [Coemansia sp. RSA 1086]KAJ1750343.1 hypothetical protein LPJ79_002982 [Coemansia sp. RSA 1821]KAJ1864926.1 hypothetical protein LPJ78_003047 [Coemansia sp. RSA 989]KAJ1873212.1 hypothetical protein LPJ55_002468 [Coemansia sp. RSA 990]KAJ2672239.1 hypothetical protein IWW42_002965 [Coemansia sp. RSA 1085]